MKLICLDDATKEMDFQREQMNIGVDSYKQNHMFWKNYDTLACTADDMQGLANEHFSIAKQAVEEAKSFETVEAFAKRMRVDISSVLRGIEKGLLPALVVLPCKPLQHVSPEQIQTFLKE